MLLISGSAAVYTLTLLLQLYSMHTYKGGGSNDPKNILATINYSRVKFEKKIYAHGNLILLFSTSINRHDLIPLTLESQSEEI